MCAIKQEKPRGRPSLSDQARDAKRAEIKSIALRLFLEEGFESVSMRRLGKEVGMTPMALYRYFPSKLDILSDLWGYIIGLAFKEVINSSSQPQNPKDRLRRICITYVEYWQENPDHYHLVFMSSGVSTSTVKSFVGQNDITAMYEIFFVCVAELRLEPRSSASVKRATDGLLCHLHGIMHSLITMQGYPWTNNKALVEDAVESAANR